jgi:hypothetical protein
VGLIALTALNAAILLWKRARSKNTDLGAVQVSSEVDPEEYSRLHAKVLADHRTRKILIPLLKASRGTVTSREMAFLKYLGGEESKAYLLQELRQDRYRNRREAMIVWKQVVLLDSLAGGDQKRGTRSNP